MAFFHKFIKHALDGAATRGAVYPLTSAVATNKVEDDDFSIVDGTDNTKIAVFELSGITTGTTRTLTLSDASGTISLVGGTETLTGKTLTSPVINTPAIRRNVVDTGGAFATPIVLTAATSGSVYLLDDAAGLDFTLPTLSSASDVGITYEFWIVTEVTSNSYRITANASDLLVGQVHIWDKDTASGDANALIGLFRPDLSNDAVITIAGTDDTTGSLVGGWLKLTALSTSRWGVQGDLIGDGTLATIFA